MFDTVSRASIGDQHADAISRLPTGGTDKTKLNDDIQVLKETTVMSKTDEILQEKCPGDKV